MTDSIIVSNVSDASFAIGVAYGKQQTMDIQDIVSLKSFANSEFCPRFLLDNQTEDMIGHSLEGKSVYIISTTSPHHSRNELAMRNCLVASAAKENGADVVTLIEPDLFYSAQDRGPRTKDHPQITSFESRKKFIGQPWSAKLYARLLHQSGVDRVLSVHNHKPKVIADIYKEVFQQKQTEKPCFINLDIAHIVANYILRSGLARVEGGGSNVGFVAPDSGAVEFVSRVRDFTGLKNSVLVNVEKTRHGQRNVELNISDDVELLQGRDVFILDDMVRTGGTIAASVKLLAENEKSRPANIFFYCTHTYISAEGRENLNSPYLNQFITTNTIPSILNRDDQGRLRKKTVVLKLERWIANAIIQCLEHQHDPEVFYGKSSVSLAGNWYEVDISSKNLQRFNTRFVQYALV
ncbi:MAG: ribose-phosphate pyrophosphokinase [SAR324 cluster bacterium]|nr:ribose-phosphate pyrophosphokinase [SAR324 cluster bacterium]